MHYRKGVIVIAVVLIVLLLAVIYFNQNTTLSSFGAKRYNLTNQYNLSDSRVIGYGIYNQDDINSLNKLIAESQDIFDKYNDENRKIYFIFGNENEVTLVSYGEIFNGNIGLVLGDKYGIFKIRTEDYKSKKLQPIESKIEVEIEGAKYNFDLKKNENSYFIIYKNITREL